MSLGLGLIARIEVLGIGLQLPWAYFSLGYDLECIDLVSVSDTK